MDYPNVKKYEVIWLNSFKNELSHIYNYLSVNLNEHSVAKKLHKKILNSLYYLSYYPNIYQKINHRKNIRRIPIDKYVILYTVDNLKKQVFLLHIFYGNQNYLNKI